MVFPVFAVLLEKLVVPTKARRKNHRENTNAVTPFPQHEVEAFQASDGSDMPIFANILPKPMTSAQATSLPPGPAASRANSGRKGAETRALRQGQEGGGRDIPRIILEEHA